MSESVEAIGSNAFGSDSALSYIYIPGTITEINDTAFSGICSAGTAEFYGYRTL